MQLAIKEGVSTRDNYQIFVRGSKGKTTVLNVKHEDTVRHLKQQLETTEGKLL